MIGVDTNVLVRLFVNETSEQTGLAIAFFNDRSVDDPAYISMIVLVEFAWVLGRQYKFSHVHIARAIKQLLEASDIVIERNDIVNWAIERFAQGKVDLADLIIAEVDRQARCQVTVTFDRIAANRVPGMELLG